MLINNCNQIWTISIVDREDPDRDIWTASFTTEEQADSFMQRAIAKLKKYDCFETVDVSKDCSYLDDETYLDWIDERYADDLPTKTYKVWLRGWVEVEAKSEDDALEAAVDNLASLTVTGHHAEEKSLRSD